VLDHLFNLTKNSNVIGRLSYDLTQFFDNLAVAYFFGPPCNCRLQPLVVYATCSIVPKAEMVASKHRL